MLLFGLSKSGMESKHIDLFYQPVNSNLAPHEGYVVKTDAQLMKIHSISMKLWNTASKFDATPTVNMAVLTDAE